MKHSKHKAKKSAGKAKGFGQKKGAGSEKSAKKLEKSHGKLSNK